MDHLHESARRLLQLPVGERIQIVLNPDSRWVPHTVSDQLLAEMKAIFTQPQSNRPKDLLVIGSSNNGKTRHVDRLVRVLHPPDQGDPRKRRDHVPVVAVQVPPGVEESKFLTMLLEKLRAPVKAGTSKVVLEAQSKVLLSKLGTVVILLDEYHHLFSGNAARQRYFLKYIKFLSNELRIAFIAFGVKQAWSAHREEEQMNNRFRTFIIPRWTFGDAFRELLAGFESGIPLVEPSGLGEDDAMAKWIYNRSEGLIGEVSDILGLAAEDAIRAGTERITLGTLQNIRFKSPKERIDENQLAVLNFTPVS